MTTILVPFTTAELGGSQLSFFRLAQLLKNDYHFVVWSFENGPFVEKLQQSGFTCKVLPYHLLRNPFGMMKLKRLLKDLNPHHIYLHSSRVISYLARKLKIPCIEKINMTRTEKSGGWSRFRFIDKFFSNFNSKILVVSKALKEQMIERGVAEKNIDYMYTFIHQEDFQNNTRHSTRKELSYTNKDILVVNIGRLVKQKGQSDFITTASKCFKENKNLQFLIVGEGPLKPSLQKQAKELCTDEFLKFQPFRQDIANIYQAADIVVHCAHWEPLANVLLEARAAGKAIVASDVDGSQEALQGYPYYDLVEVGNTDALAEKILSWSHDVPCLKPPPLPKQFTASGAKEQFEKIFPKQ